jgi:hypothetical protein
VALVLACSTTSIQVQAETDPAADFTAWRSFAWAPEAAARKGNIDVDDLIRQEVETRLTERGYVLDADSPDFLVDYRAALESKSARENVSSNRGNRQGRGRSYDSLEGSIVIEFLDPASTKVLWRGVAQDDVPLYGSRKAGGRVPEAVELIISRVPKAS